MTGWKGVRSIITGSTHLVTIQYTCYSALFPMPTAGPTPVPTTLAPTTSQQNPYYVIRNVAGKFRCLRPLNETKMTFAQCEEF